MKSLLCILSSPPYLGSRMAERIDSILVAAVFDMPTKLLFRGEAISALLHPSDQIPTDGHQNVSKMLKSLATYDIEDIYVCAEALAEFGLTPDQLVVAAKPLSPAEQGRLIAEQPLVMTA